MHRERASGAHFDPARLHLGALRNVHREHAILEARFDLLRLELIGFILRSTVNFTAERDESVDRAVGVMPIGEGLE
jgi:hypothetical protein